MSLPHRVDRCKCPTPKEVKLSLLYNDIGYKRNTTDGHAP